MSNSREQMNPFGAKLQEYLNILAREDPNWKQLTLASAAMMDAGKLAHLKNDAIKEKPEAQNITARKNILAIINGLDSCLAERNKKPLSIKQANELLGLYNLGPLDSNFKPDADLIKKLLPDGAPSVENPVSSGPTPESGNREEPSDEDSKPVPVSRFPFFGAGLVVTGVGILLFFAGMFLPAAPVWKASLDPIDLGQWLTRSDAEWQPSKTKGTLLRENGPGYYGRVETVPIEIHLSRSPAVMVHATGVEKGASFQLQILDKNDDTSFTDLTPHISSPGEQKAELDKIAWKRKADVQHFTLSIWVSGDNKSVCFDEIHVENEQPLPHFYWIGSGAAVFVGGIIFLLWAVFRTKRRQSQNS